MADEIENMNGFGQIVRNRHVEGGTCHGTLIFYLFLPIFCILRNQVTIPSLHVMARKYSHVMVCHMSDCVVLVDQAHDESRG